MADRYQLLPCGFHGDSHLCDFIDKCIDNCDYFIETGTNVGSTVKYVAEKYPYVQCLSCEPDTTAYQLAVQNTRHLSNVEIFNLTSQNFMQLILKELKGEQLMQARVLFWLDAHGSGFVWPLRQEVSFTTGSFRNAYIFIDDFQVPDYDCFGYDEYNGQVCSLDYISGSIKNRSSLTHYSPCYTEHTSSFHPLRGWVMFATDTMPQLLTDSSFVQQKPLQ